MNACKGNSEIQISSGIYLENLTITKPNITLMAKNENQNIMVISINNPTLVVDLPQSEICTIIGLKLAHSGNQDDQ